MPFFIVTMTLSVEFDWTDHEPAHIQQLSELLDAGWLKAYGRLTDQPLGAAFLIFQASDRRMVEQMIAADPFAERGLIETLTIADWDPILGVFADNAEAVSPGTRVAAS